MGVYSKDGRKEVMVVVVVVRLCGREVEESGRGCCCVGLGHIIPEQKRNKKKRKRKWVTNLRTAISRGRGCVILLSRHKFLRQKDEKIQSHVNEIRGGILCRSCVLVVVVC